MKNHNSWHDQDKFWELFEPFLFTEDRQSSMQEEVKNVVKLLKIKQNDRILDLCCGIGRHSLELSPQGFKVVGVDRTSAFIKKAKQKAKQKDLNAEFVVSDMREYCQPDRFNIIINMFGSFGYFENDDDNRKVVKNMHASLCPGGRFLIETMGKEILAKEFREKDWSEDGDILVLSERKPSHNWSRMNTRWIVIKDNKRVEYTVSLRSYSAEELSSLFYEGGFSKVEVFGDLEGIEYDQHAKRLVVIGRK
jgi:SAM-dependent methyltransferase